MASNGLIGAIAQPTNHIAQAYGARTEQLDQKRQQETQEAQRAEQQRDADFHKVVTYAGDGLVDEAKYFAQQKGLQVPEAVFQNGTFAKGLSMAGSIYADDPEKAQLFTDAFMKTEGDLNTRFQTGIQVAGKPVSQSDRDFQNFVRKEQWKLKNNPSGGSGFTLSPGASRYDAAGNVIATAPGKPEDDEVAKYASKLYQDTYLKAVEGDGLTAGSQKSPEEAHALAMQASENYKRAFGGQRVGSPDATTGAPQAPQAQISTGLIASEPPSNQPVLINERDLQAFIEQARDNGYSDDDIMQELERRGVVSGN